MEPLELSCIASGTSKWYKMHFVKLLGNLLSKLMYTYTIIQVTFPREIKMDVHKKPCTRIFRQASFIIVLKWKQPKYHPQENGQKTVA